jgi:hypothetical protein
MRLHLTDYHLESARLCLAMGDKHPEAQDHYEKAKTLIDETGYHRRNKELEELAQKLADSKQELEVVNHFIAPIGYDTQEGNAMPTESGATTPPTPNPEYDLNNIVKLLGNAFDAVGFETFAMVHFFEVYAQFTPGMMQQARINLLVTRVNISGKMEAMLEAVKTENQHQFDAFGPYVKS